MSESLSKSGNYAADNADGDNAERMQRKVTGEIRYRVRRFCAATPFSQEWVDMVDSLKFLASVAASECDAVATATAPDPAPQQAGASANATVWEREEVCLRVIVEEGKINLMMRSMADFKLAAYTSPGIPTDLVTQARSYEHSLGMLIKCGLTTIECLQTLDMRAMLDHIAAVLTHAVSPACTLTPGDTLSQEVVVVHYLRNIAAQIERIRPDDVMEKLLDVSIMQLLASHYDKFRTVLDKPVVASYLFFFAHCFDTEFFKTKIAAYFPDKEAKKAFARQFEPVVKEHVAGTPADKKALRPLSDFCLRYK